MTLPVDPLATLLDFLRADADLTSLVGSRIYGLDRPVDASGAALTASLSGGTTRPDLPVAHLHVELRCWGGTGPDGPQRAMAIWRAVHGAVNVARPASPAALLWIVEGRGPSLLRDPDTDEAFVRTTLRLAVHS